MYTDRTPQTPALSLNDPELNFAHVITINILSLHTMLPSITEMGLLIALRVALNGTAHVAGN